MCQPWRPSGFCCLRYSLTLIVTQCLLTSKGSVIQAAKIFPLLTDAAGSFVGQVLDRPCTVLHKVRIVEPHFVVASEHNSPDSSVVKIHSQSFWIFSSSSFSEMYFCRQPLNAASSGGPPGPNVHGPSLGVLVFGPWISVLHKSPMFGENHWFFNHPLLAGS